MGRWAGGGGGRPAAAAAAESSEAGWEGGRPAAGRPENRVVFPTAATCRPDTMGGVSSRKTIVTIEWHVLLICSTKLIGVRCLDALVSIHYTFIGIAYYRHNAPPIIPIADAASATASFLTLPRRCCRPAEGAAPPASSRTEAERERE